MKKNILCLKTVEFSPSQKCFHVGTVLEMIRDNRRVFKKKSMTDYLCIGIFETESELQSFLDDEVYPILERKLKK